MGFPANFEVKNLSRPCDKGRMIDGDWIKARLTGRRGEKARLSEALGVRDADVSKILNGTRKVQASEIPALLAFFGEPAINDEDAEFLALLHQASPERRAEAKAFLRVALALEAGEAAPASRPIDDE